MNHRRKIALRRATPKRLDSQVVMFSYLQSDARWHHWKMRTLTLRTALQMVADGEAVVVTRAHKGQILTMYRESKPLKPSLPTPCTLTLASMNAMAVSGGRLTRGERAQVDKVICWPFDAERSDRKPIFRCPTIRPAVGERERKQYDALMRQAQGVRPKAREVKSRTQAIHYAPVAA